jgi:hypothetical protein
MHGVIRPQVASQPSPEAGIRSAISLAFLPLAVLIATAAVISEGIPLLSCIFSIFWQSTMALAVTPSPRGRIEVFCGRSWASRPLSAVAA